MNLWKSTKRLGQSVLGQLGYVLFNTRRHYGRDGLFTVHHPRFLADPRFEEAYSRGVAASHGVDPQFQWRIHVAIWAAQLALHTEGDFAECGVNAGFVSSAIMKYLDWNEHGRKFYLIDTFDGPVMRYYSQGEVAEGRLAVAQQAIAAGAYVTDLSRVRENFAEWKRAVVIQGVVPDILSTLDIERIAFLHLDLNCAYPEATALEYLWGRMAPGCVVLFDDYTYLGQHNQAESIDRVAARFGIPLLALPTGQGILVKA